MKKFLHLFVLLVIAGITYYGCQENLNDSTNSDLTKSPVAPNTFPVPTTGNGGPLTFTGGITICGTSKVVDLFAGQDIDVGSVTIYNDATNLYVTVNIVAPWEPDPTKTENLKLWVGTDLLLLPRNNFGNPIPGQFPYKATATNHIYTFEVPLDELSLVNECGDLLYIVLHADVSKVLEGGGTQQETAFGGDTGGDSGSRWWYYTTFNIQCCDTPPDLDHSETAFAKGNYVFTTEAKSNPEHLPSLELSKNRWGWAINLTGTGETTYDIWAGAGLNKTSNGVKVGTLAVNLNGSTVTMTYNLFSSKYLQEVHLYVNDLKPTTIAPGQYGFTEYFDPMATTFTKSFEVTDSNSDGIWIIAHAVVNW